MRVYSALTVPAALAVLLMSASAAHAAAPKACDLLTSQIATSLLGGPVSAPTDVQGMLCSYGTKTATVSLAVVDSPGMAAADFTRANMAGGRSSGIEQIPGLGDAGFFIPAGGDHNTMNVLYHNKVLNFGVQKKLTPELKSQMIQTMKQWLAKF